MMKYMKTRKKLDANANANARFFLFQKKLDANARFFLFQKKLKCFFIKKPYNRASTSEIHLRTIQWPRTRTPCTTPETVMKME
jgi:hypothetical protein